MADSTRLIALLLLLSTACQAQPRTGGDRAPAPATVAPQASLPAAARVATPYEPELARAIAAAAAFEVEGRPCLARTGAWPAALTPDERRRQREIRSDSHWLNRFVRARYGERLAYSGLRRRGGRFVHVVALTGSQPIPPLRLGDRAAGVPVEIVYDAPWSLEEVMRRRIAAGETMRRLVPDAQGEGFVEMPEGGWISLDVYSPDGRPRQDVLGHCDALRRAYRLPVLIRFISARVSLM